jgi:hypothetical protein
LAGCYCHETTVDCSNRGLKDIPMEIPTTTTKLLLSDNFIKKIPAFGLFNRYCITVEGSALCLD